MSDTVLDGMEASQSLEWRTSPAVRLVADAAALVWRWSGDLEGQRPTIGRLTAHIGVVLVVVVLIAIGSFKLATPSGIAGLADRTLLDGLAQEVDAAPAADAAMERPYYRVAAQARIARQADIHTAIPERPRLEIEVYTVGAGDTAEKIAEHFGLLPTTLMWSNPEMEKVPDLLRIGQELVILPLDGVYHTIGMSDTLASIAQAYKADVDAIVNCEFNTLPEGGELPVGGQLIVPGGTKPYTARNVTAYSGPVVDAEDAVGVFRWPASGYLTQGYWYGHRAIDIGAAVGAAIKTSDNGFVSFAGWTDIGYGYLVVVDHRNGYETYYAHLSNIFVREGEVVVAGETIGAMGSTGNSTGPHLHYEIRFNGYPTNPLIYLP